jgi:serine/threonine protein kinase
MPVRKADLGPLTEIKGGGFGIVYSAPHHRMPGDHGTPLAYKEFTKAVPEQAQTADRSVLFRDLLPPRDRDDLDRHAVWPRALVEERGSVVGFVMPLIPGGFFHQLADAQSGQTTKQLRDLQWLNATRQQRTANGLPADVDFVERLALLTQLVYSVARLHKHDWIFGDISFSNAAYALDPPRMVLLDCDGATSLAQAALAPAVSTFSWEPPEAAQVNLATKATDVYKLGLAILRCLNPDGAGATIRDPRRLTGQLDAIGVALMARALSPDPALRPQAKELYRYLQALLSTLISPPAVLMAQLLTPIRPRGTDARVQFAVRNVPEVTITVGGAGPMTVPVNVPGEPQVHSFPVQASGRVVLEARNRFSTVRADLGELELFEMPQFDPASVTGILPRIPAPSMESFNADVLAPALAATPRIEVPQVPQLPSMATPDLPRKLRELVLPDADLGGALQLPRFADIARLPDFNALAGAPLRAIAESLTDAAALAAESARPAYVSAMVNAGRTTDEQAQA